MMLRHEQPTPGPALARAANHQALVPVLETTRTRMRAPRLEDFPGFCTIMTTDRGKYVDGPVSREDAWFDFIGLASNWMLHGHGGWSVENTDGTLLGFVALGLEPGDREVELGYLLLEEAEGQGFATEATTAARDWGFGTLRLNTLVSYIDRENHRSIAVAERLGAVEDTPADFPKDSYMYRHLPPGARA